MCFNHLNLMVYKLPNFNKFNIYFRHIHLTVYVTAVGVRFGLASYTCFRVGYVCGEEGRIRGLGGGDRVGWNEGGPQVKLLVSWVLTS